MTDTHAEIIPGLEDEPPAKEDLPSALAAAAPRRWINSATPVFLALFVLAAGLLGGVLIQKHWGTTTSTSAASRTGGFARTGASADASFSPGAGFGSGAGFPGVDAGGQTAASATSGTVTSVTDGTILLTTSTGTVVTVTLSGTTKVQKSATKSALKIGETVTVQGSTATDGSVTATSVAIS